MAADVVRLSKQALKALEAGSTKTRRPTEPCTENVEGDNDSWTHVSDESVGGAAAMRAKATGPMSIITAFFR